MDKSLQLKIVTRLQDQLSGPLRRIRGVSGEAGTGIKALQDSLRSLQTAQKELAEYGELRASLKNTGYAVQDARQKVAALSEQMRSAPTKELAKELQTAQARLSKVGQEFERGNERLRGLKQRLSDAGVSTKDLASSQGTLATQVTEANAALSEQRERLNRVRQEQRRLTEAREQYNKTQSMAANMAASGAAGAATGSAALYAGAKMMAPGLQFDAEISRVQALARLAKDSEELAALRQQARDLGASTMFSATEAAQGQAYLAMAGFSAADIMKSMPAMLDMAKAGNIELGRTADVASNILSGFGLDSSEMTRVADVLTKAFTTSNTTLESLGTTMKYVGPVAKEAGMSLEEAAAMAGLLGNVGIQADQAGTTLRAMLLRLAAPTGGARTALKDLGIEVTDQSGNLRNMVDIVAETAKALEGMGNGARLEQLKTIFGEEPAAGMAEILNQAGSGGILKYLDVIKDSAGSAQQTAKVMADNMVGDLDNLSSAWEDLGIQIQEQQNAVLRDLVGMLTEVIGTVKAWIVENPQLASTIVRVAAIVAALVAAGGTLMVVMAGILGPLAMARYAFSLLRITGGGFVTTLIGLAKTALPAVGAALATLGKLLLANPIGLIAAAIAAAAVAIYANWDTLGPMFQRLWDTVVERTSQAWAQVTGFFTGAWEEIKAGFSGGIAGIGATILNWSPLGLFYQAFAQVMNYLGVDLPSRFTEFGSMIMQGLINGITGMVSGVKDAVVGVADSTVGWFKEKLGIQSPSRVFIGMGENVSEGAAIGIERGRELASKAAAGLSAVVAAMGMAGQPAFAQESPFDGLLNALNETRPQITASSQFGELSGALSQIMPSLGQAAGAMPAIAFDQRAPLAAAPSVTPQGAGRGYGMTGGVTIEGDTINITITTSGGEHAQDIARAISAELDRRERQKAARARSSLTDYGL